jgi:hypothetical protein
LIRYLSKVKNEANRKPGDAGLSVLANVRAFEMGGTVVILPGELFEQLSRQQLAK